MFLCLFLFPLRRMDYSCTAGRLSLKTSQYSSKQQVHSPRKPPTGSLSGVPWSSWAISQIHSLDDREVDTTKQNILLDLIKFKGRSKYMSTFKSQVLHFLINHCAIKSKWARSHLKKSMPKASKFQVSCTK